MSSDQQFRDQLVAAAARPRHAPDLDEIIGRAHRRRTRRRIAWFSGTVTVAGAIIAVVFALPSSIIRPAVDDLPSPPIALLNETSDTLPSGESILDSLDIDHDPGRSRTIDRDPHTFVIATRDAGTLTCLYGQTAASGPWSGGCKPTSGFQEDGWLILTIRTDETPPITAILTRDDVNSVRSRSGLLELNDNLAVTTDPISDLEFDAARDTSQPPRTSSEQAGTIVH